MNFWQKLFGTGQNAGQPAQDDFDPHALLEQARREMQQLHAKNRERAVEAITAKNNLEQRLTQMEKRVAALRAEAEAAVERGGGVPAEEMLRETQRQQEALIQLREEYARVVAVADAVKASIRAEEERIRQKTAEAMLLQAQWNTMQVQRSLLASLVEVNTGSARTVPVAERAVRHALNHRRVRQALVQRNNLQQMANDAARQVNTLREKAKLAREREQDDWENALLREMEQYEAVFVQTRDAAHQAGDVTERAVQLLEEEEKVLRSQGINPDAITDDEVSLYEARAALAVAEGKRSDRAAKAERQSILLWLLLLLVGLAVLLAFL